MSMGALSGKIARIVMGKVDEYLTKVYTLPIKTKNLVDFRVGIISLIMGNIFCLFVFNATERKYFFVLSFITMSALLIIMLSASKRKKVLWVHYLLTWISCYLFGLFMFIHGDSEKGVATFGLVYPVLSIFVLKFWWGNTLIAAIFISGLVINQVFSPEDLANHLRSVYVCLYIMFWFISNSMEESRSFMERRMHEQQEKLAFYANYDPLTSMYNRRSFLERVEEMYPREKLHTSVAFMILDVDNFKRINDTYGHNVGDKVLVEVAKRIRETARGTDLCCRWGGEEFLVMGRVTDETSAIVFAQKVCDAIGKIPFELEGETTLPVTVSVGVVYTEKLYEIELESITRQADDNLYRAKAEGKNRVCANGYDSQVQSWEKGDKEK